MTNDTIPAHFTPVSQGVPAHDRPVLGIRRSGYITCTYEVRTVRYVADYSEPYRWRDLGNEGVGASGEEILGWAEMDDWLLPTPKEEQARTFDRRTR